MQELLNNPVCFNIFAAGFLRSLANVIVTHYLPVFFQKVFPLFKSEYSMINAFSLTLFGLSSSIIGGIISDKFEKKSYMAKTALILFGNLFSIPLVILAMSTNNFYLAISLMAVKILITGTYLSPSLTMM